jgi:hypothetical protein
VADHHPHLLALLKRWCKEQGGSYDLWLERLERRAPVPQAMAEAIEREYGTPRDTWVIEPTLKVERTRARAVQAPKRKMTVAAVPGRGQQPANPEHALHRALAKRKLSLRAWCKQTGEPLATWSSRLTGRYRTPREDAERIARLFPGEVAVEDFDLAYERKSET